MVAVATKEASGVDAVGPGDEQGLHLEGFLTFSDPPKEGAGESLARLAALGITVKVVTGDNALVARKVCTRPRHGGGGEPGRPGHRTP